MHSKNQKTQKNERNIIIEETKQILRGLDLIDQISVLLFAVVRMLRRSFTFRKFLYMYAVLIPTVTIAIIPKSTPSAWVVQVGWGSLAALGLVLILRFHPSERKYHYVNKKKNFSQRERLK